MNPCCWECAIAAQFKLSVRSCRSTVHSNADTETLSTRSLQLRSGSAGKPTASHKQIKPLILLGPLTEDHGNKLTQAQGTHKHPPIHTSTQTHTHNLALFLNTLLKPVPDD